MTNVSNILIKLCLVVNFVYCKKVLTFWIFPKFPKKCYFGIGFYHFIALRRNRIESGWEWLTKAGYTKNGLIDTKISDTQGIAAKHMEF